MINFLQFLTILALVPSIFSYGIFFPFSGYQQFEKKFFPFSGYQQFDTSSNIPTWKSKENQHLLKEEQFNRHRFLGLRPTISDPSYYEGNSLEQKRPGDYNEEPVRQLNQIISNDQKDRSVSSTNLVNPQDATPVVNFPEIDSLQRRQLNNVILADSDHFTDQTPKIRNDDTINEISNFENIVDFEDPNIQNKPVDTQTHVFPTKQPTYGSNHVVQPIVPPTYIHHVDHPAESVEEPIETPTYNIDKPIGTPTYVDQPSETYGPHHVDQPAEAPTYASHQVDQPVEAPSYEAHHVDESIQTPTHGTNHVDTPTHQVDHPIKSPTYGSFHVEDPSETQTYVDLITETATEEPAYGSHHVDIPIKIPTHESDHVNRSLETPIYRSHHSNEPIETITVGSSHVDQSLVVPTHESHHVDQPTEVPTHGSLNDKDPFDNQIHGLHHVVNPIETPIYQQLTERTNYGFEHVDEPIEIPNYVSRNTEKPIRTSTYGSRHVDHPTETPTHVHNDVDQSVYGSIYAVEPIETPAYAHHVDHLSESPHHANEPIETATYGSHHIEEPIETSNYVDKPAATPTYRLHHVDQSTEGRTHGSYHVDDSIEIPTYRDQPTELPRHVDEPTDTQIYVSHHVEKPIGISTYESRHVDQPIGISNYVSSHVNQPTEGSFNVERPTEVQAYGFRGSKQPIEVLPVISSSYDSPALDERFEITPNLSPWEDQQTIEPMHSPPVNHEEQTHQLTKKRISNALNLGNYIDRPLSVISKDTTTTYDTSVSHDSSISKYNDLSDQANEVLSSAQTSLNEPYGPRIITNDPIATSYDSYVTSRKKTNLQNSNADVKSFPGCGLTAIDDNEYSYYHTASKKIMNCAPGSMFSESLCTCIHAPTFYNLHSTRQTPSQVQGKSENNAGCYLLPVDNAPTLYYNKEFLNVMKCAPGTVFSQNACTCIHNNDLMASVEKDDCEESYGLTFEDNYLKNSNSRLSVGGGWSVKLHDGVAEFNQDSTINFWSYMGKPYGDSFTIQMKFKDFSSVTSKQNLVTNCGTSYDKNVPSILVELNKNVAARGKDYHVRIAVVTEISQSEITLPVKSEVFNTLRVIYNKGHLEANIRYPSGETFSEETQCSGKVLTSTSDLRLGACDMKHDGFVGVIDWFKFYPCGVV